MSILINKDTRFITQDMTGATGIGVARAAR
jgi:succinyl-CoA synthetase alpha subunit